LTKINDGEKGYFKPFLARTDERQGKYFFMKSLTFALCVVNRLRKLRNKKNTLRDYVRAFLKQQAVLKTEPPTVLFIVFSKNR